MDLGDFFVQFMDLAEDEMKKNTDGILFVQSVIALMFTKRLTCFN